MSEPAPEQPDRRPPAGPRHGRGQPAPGLRPAAPAESQPAATGGPKTDASQAGIDARRRGWFWHWNTVVTQYSPLIGLKGVGLLNSYTVWTDRREESPHRGYAFPSQQAEADFYGEDRAELITINKILVALDLIEIRKEMILRVDERGRRWRVPHNLYRVKDRDEGVTLRARDVMAVATLAASDDAVYRYVRRIFSPRFEPIDRDSIWHAILVEVADEPLWQELQQRTRDLEERASARTRAGHRQRARAAARTDSLGAVLTDGQKDVNALPHDERQAPAAASEATSVAPANDGRTRQKATIVADANSGSGSSVEPGNDGSPPTRPTSAGPSSTGSPTAVAPANTTYDQDQITTTTTTTTPRARAGARPLASTLATASPVDRDGPTTGTGRDTVAPSGGAVVPIVMNGVEEGIADDRASGALVGRVGTGDPAGDGPARAAGGQLDGGRASGQPPAERGLDRAAGERAGGPVVDPCPLVVSIFEAANDRRTTPLERILLGELERDADPPARAAGSTGSDWVVAALREAVASGSAFVAPKRIREIIQRWAADGDGPRRASDPGAPALAGAAGVTPPAGNEAPPPADVRLPGGARGSRTWAAVLDDLATVLSDDTFDLLLGGSVIRRYWRGTVEVEVGAQLAADKLSTEYRALVERQLNARLSKPVAVSFHVAEPSAAPAATAVDATRTAALVVSRADVDLGRQVWHAVLADLAAVLGPGDAERLSGVVPLGQDAAGLMLLASPSPVARRLLDGRYRADVERSLSTLLGHETRVRLVGRDEWAVAEDVAGASD